MKGWKMKLGYFTEADIPISETFVYDLMKGLESRTELTWFCGKSTIKNQIVKTHMAINYSPARAILPRLAFKLGNCIGRKGHIWRMKMRLFLSNHALKKLDQNYYPDVAYTDFLTSAVLLRHFFETKEIPYIVHVHGFDISSALIDNAYRMEIKKVFKSVKYIIAASHYIRRLLILEGCSPEKIIVIRLGIDTQSIIPLNWMKRLENKPSIIFLGRLTEKKNPIALIHAFNIVRKKIPDVKLSIIGDGPMLGEIENLINALSLQDVVSMLGALPRDKSFPIMNQHWIYAQHSITAISGDKEGYAISPAEAAAHELPVVSTIHNGIPEHVLEGITGYLVPEFDYETMAERMIYLIHNPELAEKMGKEGRKNIEKLNDPRKRIDSIFNLLEECLS